MSEVIEGLRIGFVDCESTGIGPDDEPISIGMVLVKLDAKGYGEPFAEWYGEQEPSVPIHPKAAKVHGKTVADLAGKRFDRAGLREIMEQADILVAHHASFDARMLLKVEPDTLGWEWRCSRRQWVWPVMRDKKLDTVCEHFGIERPATHDALADAHVLRLALMQRTGKTDRSRVYMHRLMYRGECDVRPRAPRRESERRAREPRHLVARPPDRSPSDYQWTPPETKQPIKYGGAFAAAIGLLLLVALARSCGA